jgi:maleamate amidohydrolase
MPIRLRQRQRSEGCFDRSEASHAINLCDMNAKYADVVKVAEAKEFIESLPDGLFELPRGTARMAKAANF